MSTVTMPEAAEQFGINPDLVSFAARLGRLPEPVGRNPEGLLLFDASEVATSLGVVSSSLATVASEKPLSSLHGEEMGQKEVPNE